MPTRRKTIFIVLLAIAAVAGVVLALTRKDTRPEDLNLAFLPVGWYAHAMGNGNILLTRQKDLPDIGATEGLAYGEQIAMSWVQLDQPIDAWIAQRIPDNDPLYTAKERGTLNGYQTLKVEHETEAAGKILDYYIFSDKHTVIFSLYPLESTDAVGKTTRNTADVKILEQLVKDYTSKL